MRATTIAGLAAALALVIPAGCSRKEKPITAAQQEQLTKKAQEDMIKARQANPQLFRQNK
jgi:hypothetical protein